MLDVERIPLVPATQAIAAPLAVSFVDRGSCRFRNPPAVNCRIKPIPALSEKDF